MNRKYFVFAFIVFFSTAYTSRLPSDQELFNILCGKWKGVDKDQQIVGLARNWIVKRYKDGTYTIQFHLTVDESFKKLDAYQIYLKDSLSEEYGYWFIENGIFYETNDSLKPKKHSYNLEIITRDKIKFTTTEPKWNFDNPDYSFYDIRIPEL